VARGILGPSSVSPVGLGCPALLPQHLLSRLLAPL